MTNQQRMIGGLLLVFIGYILSTAFTTSVIPFVFGYDCTQTFLSVKCDLPADQVRNGLSEAVMALYLAGIAAVMLFKRQSTMYPFIMMTVVMAGLAMTWDAFIGNAILNSPKITNDTINILAAVIAASFVLILLILRKQTFSLIKLAQAILLSYLVKTVASIALVMVGLSFYGATELFFVYVFYAFGAFTVHLMTVSSFIASQAGETKGATL